MIQNYGEQIFLFSYSNFHDVYHSQTWSHNIMFQQSATFQPCMLNTILELSRGSGQSGNWCLLYESTLSYLILELSKLQLCV